MPRPMRRGFAGAICHVMNRGDRREEIFRDEPDRRMCLATLSEAFRQELLAWAAERLGATHYGAERREAQESKALRWLREEMGRLGWDAGALRQAGKGEARKVRLAARIRKDTTMSLQWIAQHLEMGRWTHVSILLGAKRKQESLKSEN